MFRERNILIQGKMYKIAFQMSTVVLFSDIKKREIMKKKNLVPFLLLILFLSCSGRMDREAQIITDNLTLEQKTGQLLMFALPGQALNNDNSKLISKYQPGGIILFGYNISEKGDLPEFIHELQQESMNGSGIPLFVSTDQEGGRVIRVKKGITPFPGNLAAGISENYDGIKKMAQVTGMELRIQGINMNLAPVLDVNNNPLNPVINTRSFGSDPGIVAKAGASYIDGLQSARCIAVAKHFPGHGDTESDSHHVLPVINHDMGRLKKVELVPFYKAIKEKVECIMSAHILFPAITENDEPATLSKFFLTDLLRKEMGFSGIVMTDDLEMNAVSGKMNLGDAAVKSFLAGSDVILVSSYGENIPVIYNALLAAVKDGTISMERLNVSVKRIMELKLRYKIAGFDEEKQKIYFNDFKYTIKEKELLTEKDAINSMLSRESIFYSGESRLYGRGENEKRIYVSGNRDFRENLKINSGDEIFYSAEKALSSLKREDDPGKVIVVLQTYRINRNYIQLLNRRIIKAGGNFLIVYSGNPFDLSGWVTEIPVLFTFSFTGESMKQAALCLDGRFEPLKKINTLTGFRD
jgi:beta-N-acetylhexosaminidase